MTNTDKLPEPIPAYCDGDHGDWEEEVFDCQHCGNRIYVELAD